MLKERFMRTALTLPLLAAITAFSSFGVGAAEPGPRLSGPHRHANLAVYFVHGASASGPVPLTLAEALEKGSVQVIETGNVNALLVENVGTDEIFIQSGDIVKGGQQDRVLTMSLLLPPKSGKVSVASFCVEQGRWAARGGENVKQFASSVNALPSREAKLAMKVPPKADGEAGSASPTVNAPIGQSGRITLRRGSGDPDGTGERQRKVWDEVANIQSGLSSRLGAKVASPQSATSLQLALENETLKAARTAYLGALSQAPGSQADIVGFVFAIDGRINSGDVYPSNALFQKMWGKLLDATVTEAIGTKGEPQKEAAPPDLPAITAFLQQAEAGKVHQATIANLMQQETRDTDKALYVEARKANGAWVHRNYLAK
jgi:hypothetical protein